jgi:hypothetical protein
MTLMYTNAFDNNKLARSSCPLSSFRPTKEKGKKGERGGGVKVQLPSTQTGHKYEGGPIEKD